MIGHVLDHEANAILFRHDQQFGEAFEVVLDDEGMAVHGRVARGVNIHPFGANDTESIDASFQFLNGRTADVLEGTANGKVKGGMAHDGEAGVLEGPADLLRLYSPHRRAGWLEGKIDK